MSNNVGHIILGKREIICANFENLNQPFRNVRKQKFPGLSFKFFILGAVFSHYKLKIFNKIVIL